MLTNEQNELLTQTGPGTPAGDLLRRWQPVALAEELPPGGGSSPRSDHERGPGAVPRLSVHRDGHSGAEVQRWVIARGLIKQDMADENVGQMATG